MGFYEISEIGTGAPLKGSTRLLQGSYLGASLAILMGLWGVAILMGLWGVLFRKSFFWGAIRT